MNTRRFLAATSVLVGLAAAGLPTLAGGDAVHAQLLLGAAGIVALLAALFGWAPGFTLAGLTLGSEYAIRLVARHRLHRLDGLAVLEAVALFTTIELGLRAAEARSIARPERQVRVGEWVRLAAMVTGAAASAFVVMALGSRRLPAPTAGLALGLAAAVLLLTAAEWLRRRATRAATPRVSDSRTA